MKEIKISYEIILEIKKYIEEAEEKIDWAWGTRRGLDELLEDENMPEVYYKICRLLEE